MEVAVLRRRTKDGQDILAGMYSTKRKAKLAAKGMMDHLDKMAAEPYKWSVGDYGTEVLYRREDGEQMTIDFWEVNKALINGEYKVI